MKKIICFSMTQLLILVTISPLVNQTAVQARPITDKAPPAYGQTNPMGPSLKPEAEQTSLLSSGPKQAVTSRIRSYETSTSYNPILVGVQEPTPNCTEAVDEIIRKLDEMGVELGKLEQALARGAGLADNALSSPVLRRTFRATMREIMIRVARHGAARIILGSLGAIGIIFDLLQILEFFDVAMENYIREDLMENNPEMTEDEAREQAEHISDFIIHQQINAAGAVGAGGGGLPAIYHLIETHMEQRSCRLHGRGPGRPRGPFRPSPNPGGSGSGGGLDCGKPPTTVNTPTLPPSTPGSNGTRGSFNGSINVTAPDPCRKLRL